MLHSAWDGIGGTDARDLCKETVFHNERTLRIIELKLVMPNWEEYYDSEMDPCLLWDRFTCRRQDARELFICRKLLKLIQNHIKENK